jgi:hypothetical protein
MKDGTGFDTSAIARFMVELKVPYTYASDNFDHPRAVARLPRLDMTRLYG